MSATVTWIGLDDLKEALLRLPAELTELSEAIVVEAAEGAAQEVRDRYPEGETGNLIKGVRVSRARRGTQLESEFAVGRVVRSTAPHAHLYESGTQTRQTALGYNRGAMFDNMPQYAAGANIFVPTMARYRRAMYEDLIAVVEDAGLDVRR